MTAAATTAMFLFLMHLSFGSVRTIFFFFRMLLFAFVLINSLFFFFEYSIISFIVFSMVFYWIFFFFLVFDATTTVLMLFRECKRPLQNDGKKIYFFSFPVP